MPPLSGRRQWALETASPSQGIGPYTTTREGLISFSVTREGNSSPSQLEVVMAAVENQDKAAVKRFYPYLAVRLVDEAHDFMPFLGRIDTAQLKELNDGSRVWVINARDWLAVLADNLVDRGKWWSSSPGRGTNHGNSDAWIPNYVGDYDNTGGAKGEYRRFIIMDLALNVIANNSIGLADVVVLHAPNSKRVEVNLDRDNSTTILDAIRELARSDPYGTFAGEVDGKAIADAGYPAGSGFGGELQIRFGRTSDDGRHAEYFSRGTYDSTLRCTYGPPSVLTTHPIFEYHFDGEGADIFSRSKPIGRGEGGYDKSTSTAGTGVEVPGMETTWDPENGLFKVRRDAAVRFDGTVGDRLQEDAPGGSEDEILRARGNRDAAYGVLLSGKAALSNRRGGPLRGNITVPGWPMRDDATSLLRPGDLLTVDIPQRGIDGQQFICTKWKYAFPEDVTVIEIARVQATTVSEHIIQGKSRVSNDVSSAHNSFYDSNWRLVDGTGTITLKHGLGVRAGKVKVEVAQHGGGITTDGLLIPKLNTETDVPATAYEASQGQNHGYAIVENTPYQVTLKLARWLAYSEGVGKWFKNNDTDTLIRVRLYA
jgi:hypothetical protein